MLVLAALTTSILMVLFLVVGVTMTLVVLVQRPKGGGLAGAFGGASTDAAAVFGASIGDVLTWITVGFFVVWILLAMGMQWSIAAEVHSIPQPPAVQTPAEPATPAPATTAPAPEPGTTQGTPTE
ncbi:preprotein translocase subunit SecG [Mucisphaera calidilacus]|uniref:Protein-export membrane protein SecG n=1 Tax=Mucisphaera calidilacus TaxID=2527982 RepID=A0A518BTS8_9BACT|nr:preprotein translocase subunit SecG [Mucisphaera calidilacus]QDU70357.1 preprotein translocase subunit SecG [Mucisphaera calidilacus]